MDGISGQLEENRHDQPANAPFKTGRPKTGGRVKGSRNRIPSGLKDLARLYTAQALDTIASIMQHSNNDVARVAAAKELLDRGYGKSKQTVDVSGNLTVTTTHTLEVMRERIRSLRDGAPLIEQRDAA